MFIDLILCVFTVAVFAGGWWCGQTYGSFASAVASAKSRVKAWL